MDYFSTHGKFLKLNVKERESEVGIRECQIGAYWAVKSHFTSHDEEPALVSLPTGAGKTALMMLLAFGLDAERVLVVAPSDVLRTQTSKKLEQLDGLIQASAIDEEVDKPAVERITERVTTDKKWKELTKADVVFALPNNISTVYNRDDLDDIVPPPEGFFDIVFFDEAHHTRALSWSKLLSDFKGAKQILLTATPFRRDRRSLPGRLVYHYPLSKAIQAGIYQPVRFYPVTPAAGESRDQQLCQTASRALEEVREKHGSARVLIRTNRISKTSSLEKLYSDLGINVETVHSNRTSTQNDDTLNRLRDGELDGVIAVGKLGEGLDIADLKIAVLHYPPKSFPFTVQLVGRIARPLETAEVEAAVIADPEQMREEGVADTVRRLYQEDRGWKELVPELVDEFVERTHRDTTPGSARILVGVDLNDLMPYFSTRLYRVSNKQLRFAVDVSLDQDTAVYRLPEVDDAEFLGVITETTDSPTWGTRTILEFTVYDLHIYYYHEGSETLFQFTTSDSIASDIRDSIVDGTLKKLRGNELVRVMHSAKRMEYLVAGLANALGPSGGLPSYKMFLGTGVEGALNPSDSRVFIRGHALARIGDEETRGISDQQARVWSMKRGTVSEFIEWCDRVGDRLVANSGVKAAKGLEFLKTPRPISNFPKTPFWIGFNPMLIQYSLSVRENGGTDWREIDRARFKPVKFEGPARKILNLEFYPSSDDDGASHDGIKCAYNVEKDAWVGDLSEYDFRVDAGESYKELKGETFLELFPPYFFLDDGTLIVSAQSQKVRSTYDQLPSHCFENDLDWSDCDVRVEYEIDTANRTRKPTDGMISVHDWLEVHLPDSTREDQIIFKDHGSGEIADYIEILIDDKEISFYHCKGAPKNEDGEANIGATLDHVKDVLDQVLRSNVWIKTSRLVSKIEGRNSRDNQTHFVIGEELFEAFAEVFVPAEWSYTVAIVNPGLDHTQVQDTENVNTTLLTCFEWLQGIGAELQIMGHSNNAAD